MPANHALLVIDLAQRQRLFDAFGEAAAARALADLDQACAALIERLLARQEILDLTRSPGLDRWTVRFRITDTLRDPAEVLASIEAAGQKLLHEALCAIFGSGTGMRVPATLAAISEKQLPTQPLARWLDERRQQAATHAAGHDAAADELERILRHGLIDTVVQPIVGLDDRRVRGYEALSRGPQGSPLERPDHLFNAANGLGRGPEVELACARLALERTRGRLPPGQFLSINLGPSALACAADALPLAGRSDVVFEITEHLPLDAAEALHGAIADLRRLGLRVALDDTGCGFADLETAACLRPDLVKLCITIIRNAGRGTDFVGAIRQTVAQLRALDIRVLAEGVETEAQHAALAGCGIELAQGWLYGRPQPLDAAFGAA
ncbi:MAG: EAL domain-containing protein [Rhodocyclaceae bacterium]|nr:EAL domain-containing protein [Rhodocyclaceae bacterium]